MNFLNEYVKYLDWFFTLLNKQNFIEKMLICVSISGLQHIDQEPQMGCRAIATGSHLRELALIPESFRNIYVQTKTPVHPASFGMFRTAEFFMAFATWSVWCFCFRSAAFFGLVPVILVFPFCLSYECDIIWFPVMWLNRFHDQWAWVWKIWWLLTYR